MAEEGKDKPEVPEVEAKPEEKAQAANTDEETLFQMRAKLFRYDEPTEQWKERGTGELKILSHKKLEKIRVLMRRDRTLKVCANHMLTGDMHLEANVGSDRSWMWRAADYADEELKQEVLAIRFANSENANAFKEAFDKAVAVCAKHEESEKPDEPSDEINETEVKEETEEEAKEEKKEEPAAGKE